MIAARDGDPAIVKTLLDHDADVQAGDWEADHGGPARCSGPVEWGAGHPQIVKMLLAKGASDKPHCKLLALHGRSVEGELSSWGVTVDASTR